MYKIGNRIVIVNIPKNGYDWRKEITVASMATIVRKSVTYQKDNKQWLLIFDEDVGGHSEAGSQYKGHCWNVLEQYFTLVEMSPEELELRLVQKKKEKENRVLAKIKYLDRQFEERQRRKQYAKDKDMALQNGVTQRQSITIDPAGWPSTTRASLSGNISSTLSW